MDSCEFLVNRGSSASSEIRHGSSKSQMCLAKILRIISSVPRPEGGTSKQSSCCFRAIESDETGDDEKKALLCGDRVRDVDFPCQMRKSAPSINGFGEVSNKVDVLANGESPVVSCSDEKSSEDNKLSGNSSELSRIVKLEEEICDIDKIDAQVEEKTNQPNDEDVECEESNNKRCIGLLIEAAKLIFGEFKEPEEPEPHEPMKLTSEENPIGIVGREESSPRASKLKRRRKSNKRKKKKHYVCTVDLYGEIEEVDSPPVVRSNRGRTQVLPYKYRDSVLEPLSRPFGASSPSTVSTKRRFR